MLAAEGGPPPLPQVATSSQRPSVRAVFARSDAGVTKQSGEAGRHGVGEHPTRKPTGNGASPPQVATASPRACPRNDRGSRACSWFD